MPRRRSAIKKRKRILISLTLLTVMAVGVVSVGVLANSSDIMSNYINEKRSNISNESSGFLTIREGKEMIEPEMLEPINQYFRKSFEAVANLKTTDITKLFTESSSENARLNQNALDYLINLRLKQSNDLHMINYKCGLTISEVSEENGQVKVVVKEDHTVNFAFIPKVDSSSSGIAHTFYLKAVGDTYEIEEHYKEEDSFLMLEEAVDNSGDDADKVSDELLKEALSAVEKLSLEKEYYNSNKQKTQEPYAENTYNPEAAVKYAMTWVDSEKVIRNESEFAVYDEYGGNCNNYISQCLNAGGIPMDYHGNIDTQWKWYGETVNFEETDAGRSPSWAGVEEFHTYARENTGYGLKAVVDDNVYSGSPGDVLQYGHGGEWRHSVFITEVIKDKHGNVLDYLINSNTTDRINYPASAYGYAQQRLIKIIGWNK